MLLRGSGERQQPMADLQHWKACWPSGQDALVVTDVAAQSEHVLLAVHQPPPLRQMPVPLPGRRREAEAESFETTQESLREQLLAPDIREHTLVIPILGLPGTGKSHLIKWLKAAIPERDDLVIRHIPREGTSLPEVVRILLEGLQGGRFDELRQHMDSARSDITSLEQAATRLSLRMAELLQFGFASGWRRAANLDPALRGSLCHSDVLPSLLTDPTTRAHLTRVGGPIYRLATDIVEGYRRPEDDDDDEELGFRPEDLIFTNASLRGAGQKARRAVLNLKMPGAVEAAVRILSDALDLASPDVIGLGSVSLTDVVSDLRAELLHQKKELVLLFEDMAIARGLQLDLVDALTTSAVRDGEQRLCTLRAAVAITPTYWDEQTPEMLATRINAWGGSMFSLDVPMTESEDFAPLLIGRYLNAARLGVSTLKNEAVSVSSRVPNACDNCPFNRRDECHALFGATSAGHGLFPLTPAAAATTARVANRETVRPRFVLSGVVGPVIAERTRLDEGRFPSPDGDITKLVEGAVQRRALDELALSQLEALEDANLKAADRSRAETILRAWGLNTRSDPESVLDALNLPNLATVATAKPLDTTPAPEPGPSDVRPTPGQQEDPRLRLVDQWAAGGLELNAELSRIVRRALFDEIKSSVRWEEIGFGQEAAFTAFGLRGSEQTQMRTAVRIVNAAGGGGASATKALVEIKPTAANARLIRGLLTRERVGSWAFPTGFDALARLRVVVREAEASLAERLAMTAFSTKTVSDAAQLLVLSAATLGVAGSDDPNTAVAASLVAVDGAAADELRSPAWKEVVRAARQSHQIALETIRGAAGRRQGQRAEITAIDSTLFDLKRLNRDPAGLRRAPKSDKIAESHQTLVRALEIALKGEAASIESELKSIEAHIGVGAALTLKTIRDDFSAAAEAAKLADALGPKERVEELEATKLPTSTAAAQLVEDARRAIAGAQEGIAIAAIARVARLDVSTLYVVARYLSCVDEVVTHSVAAATEIIEANSAGANGSAASPARAAIQAMSADVAVIASALDGGRG
jgi:hypothetical protein